MTPHAPGESRVAPVKSLAGEGIFVSVKGEPPQRTNDPSRATTPSRKPGGVSGARAALVALQRTAGNAAVASVVCGLAARRTAAGHHAGGPPRATRLFPIQRALDAQGILSALDRIPFVKKKLDQSLNLRHKGADTAKAGKGVESMRHHVEAVLDQYDAHLQDATDPTRGNALVLAAVLEGVARVIAVNELNDPGLTPTLAVKLLELYRGEIEGKLKKMAKLDDSLNLAHALVADDPLALYMHNELRLEAAARRVRMMAFAANKKPAEMFELLRHKLDLEMATHTKAGVAAREDKGPNYNVSEATGEISSRYFKQLFGDVAAPTWTSGTGGPRTLNYTGEARKRLDDLKDAVAADAQATGAPERSDLSPKQAEHLREIGDMEQAMTGGDRDDIDRRVKAELCKQLGVTLEEAATLLQKVKDGLPTLPITLTVQGVDWFGKGLPVSTTYQPYSSRRNEKSYAELFKKKGAKGTIKHLGEFPKPEHQNRGKNYLRFRNWKDQLMTGRRGFGDTELPAFAAVNVNWPAYSTQSQLAGNMGVNPYGDTHFVLKRDAIKDRVVYTATDHGAPRLDPYLAFCDLLLGGMGITQLKDTKSTKFALHVINSLTTKKPVATGNQPFEVQIFGEVDIAKHVEKIYVAPTASDAVKQNVKAFEQQRGVKCEFISDTLDVEAEGWLVPPPTGGKSKLSAQIQQFLADEKAAAAASAPASGAQGQAPPPAVEGGDGAPAEPPAATTENIPEPVA